MSFNVRPFFIVPILIATSVSASPILSYDYDVFDLGAKITGPVGPEVEVSLINSAGDSVGDLLSSVSCPQGYTVCIPANNSAGIIYTYAHTVIPGVDKENDAPFPNPPVVLPFDDVQTFSLGYEAVGFNGIAGYSFSNAATANVSFDIDLNDAGELVWSTTSDEWDSTEEITFFWQTSQAPSGPGGIYAINNSSGTASGRGPVPTALPVPEPVNLGFMLLGGVLAFRSRRK
ncbi:exosortase, PEP-CTERM interaction domain protein [Paraglaciecola sp. 20A4]|uniref:exosortase, PEP-CTERM interaction domain protein n=1 Tax=Paraglaciecola sp. 20A4 TaxID=2687288 RepID=UPI001409DED4|nr:exosortase, PEP-CTERM interaction domain protein [Paraglaciecola sp. 20A4]